MSTPHGQLAFGSALVLLAGTALLLRAAPAAPAPPSTQSSGNVDYQAETIRYLTAAHIVELTRGVIISQNDAFFKTIAAVITMDSQQRALNAKSATTVHMYDTQNDLTGSQGYVDFTRHLATLTGNIVLVIKPAKSPPASSVRSQFKDAATLTCDKMTYDYKKKLAHIPGTLTIHQKDRVLTADEGDYDTRAQTVVLKGDVHGHNGDGEISATTVTVGLKEGSEYIFLPGPNIHGSFRVPPDSDDIPPAAEPAAKPLSASPPAAKPAASPSGVTNGGAPPTKSPSH